MKNNRFNSTKIPIGTKFLKPTSDNGDDILLEFLITQLIHEGASFKILMTPIEQIKNVEQKEAMKLKITNITLDFISCNPKSAKVLKQSDQTHQFLNSIRL